MTGGEHVLIEEIIKTSNIKAAIFDLDGTILDNNSFHLKSWDKYLKDENISISPENFRKHVSGRTNEDAVRYIFGSGVSDEDVLKYTLEKEAVYRELYEPYIHEVSGFSKLLKFFKQSGTKMAIATSGIQPNIDFMFRHLPVKSYFSEVVNSAHIKRGKPDPEIYLFTAAKLQVDPKSCLVFEDSLPGVESGKSAGMVVTALTTTHSKEELKQADYIISTFQDLFQHLLPAAGS